MALPLSRSTKILLAVLGIFLLAVLWLVGSYNNFVKLEETVKTESAQIDTQYQRRFDLIPNLVESVKGTLRQEKEIFQKLAEARTQYGSGKTPAEKAKAADEFESTLSRLLVIVENYPNLRSAETVQSLMTQLEGSENRISVARQRYNEAVQTLNVAIRRFPGKIIAAIFGFKEQQRFEADAGAKEVPKVDLKLEPFKIEP